MWLSAQVPRDPDTGFVVRSLPDLPPQISDELATHLEHRDGREGPIRAQTWTVYSNLGKMLGARGSSLDRVVRQRIYLTDRRDIQSMEDTMLRFFPDRKPATFICCMGTERVHPDIRIQVEVVALEPDMDAEPVYIPELDPITSPYPLAMRVGQLLFFSGIVGLDPNTGRAITHLADLDPVARGIITTGRYATDTVEEAFKAQIATIFGCMGRVLEKHEASIDDLLRSNFLTTRGMTEWGVSSMVFRQHMYSSKQAAPTSTCVTVPHINGDDDIVAVSDALALLPGEWRKAPALDDVTDMAHLPMSIGAGPYAFHTGFIPMDKSFHGPVERFGQLGDAGRFLGSNRLDEAETIAAQSWQVYREIEKMLNAVGSTLKQAVQQTVLMRDPTQYAVVEQAARALIGQDLPATTVLPCDDIGPYPGLLLEIETIAVR
jgi:enamine deaminase RidA (YjgF/YER057c/UK114 family)